MRGKAVRSSLRRVIPNCQQCEKQAARGPGLGITDINPHDRVAGGSITDINPHDRMAGRRDTSLRTLTLTIGYTGGKTLSLSNLYPMFTGRPE